MTTPKAVTAETFDAEVLASPIPVLVDFWAAWCGPCKAMKPTIDEAAATYDGRIKVVTVDTEAEQKITARYGVRGLPCLAMFKAGSLVETKTGNAPRGRILDWLASHAAG